MLTELNISNFAIIDSQSVPFTGGLNCITGETGSGKSIILDALDLILGGRSNTSFIRTGAECLEVQAHFDLTTLDRAIFNALPDIAQNDELVIVRTLAGGGKGKVYINGRLGTVTLLSEIASRLITLCSQSNHVRLLDPKFHLEQLDKFLSSEELLKTYKGEWDSFLIKKKAFEETRRSEQNAERRTIELEDIINDLSKFKLYPTMREELEREIKKFNNAQKLLELIQGIESSFEQEEGGIDDLLKIARGKISDITRYDDLLSPSISQNFDTAAALLDEVRSELQDYKDSLLVDEETFAELSEQLTWLARMERKYRATGAELEKLLISSKIEMSELTTGGALAAREKEYEVSLEKVKKIAATLTRARKDAALRISKAVEQELSEVALVGAKFEVAFIQTELSGAGAEKAEFLLSPNKGEALKPIQTIASGGELSRILLVLKKILKDHSGINVLVFDEVDTGISGSVARTVGQKLRKLAEASQVICITHLPQVASFADHHIHVEKEVVGERTLSKMRVLDDKTKVEEISKMLAGFEVTEAVKESARQLLKKAV